MKTPAIVLFFFLLNTVVMLNAQTIQVVDEKQQPLAFAHIQLTTLPEHNTTLLLTESNGQTVVPTSLFQEYQSLIIGIRFLGFLPLIDTISFEQFQRKDHLTYTLIATPVDLNQMVVTAQYAPNNPEKSTHRVRIIDRKRIDAQGAITLRDVLQNESNIRLAEDNILGSSASIQGISGQNVKILIDGIPVIGRLNGNVDLSQINLNNIERIEIVEGPLSVNYGSNALAGTINLITKKEQKTTLEATANSYYESVGQYNLDGSIGWQFGKNELRLSGGRNFFDGWSPTDHFFSFPKSLPADTFRSKQWNAKEQFFGRLQYLVKGKKTTFRPFINYFKETIINRGFPRKPYYESAFDDTYTSWRTDGGIDLTVALEKEKRIVMLAAYNTYARHKNTYLNDLTSLHRQLTDNPSDQDTAMFSNWVTRASISNANKNVTLNYELGYDLQYEKAEGKRIAGQKKEQGDYAIFGSTEWTPKPNLVIRPGMRVIKNTAYQAPLVPSLNVKLKVKKITFRASYAKGFRAPSLKELHFEFVDINHNILGNNALKAEHSSNFQLHASWQKAIRSSRIKAELGGFHNNMVNLITLAQTPSGTLFSYVNIGTHKTTGFQNNAEVAWRHLKLSAGGAYVGRYNTLSNRENSVQKYSFSPEFRSGLHYDFHHWNSTLSIFYKYTGKLPGFSTDDNNLIQKTTVNDYQMVDLTASKLFWKKKLRWTIGVKNLLDVQQITATNSTSGGHSTSSNTLPVSWGRSLFTGIKFYFNG
jgi:outer membrane receptor for ferrienterochelin and colicins